MKNRLDTTVPQPFPSIYKSIFWLRDKCWLDSLGWVVQICHNVFYHEGLKRHFFPSTFQTSQLKKKFFDLFVNGDEVNFTKIWHFFLPNLSISLRNQVWNIVTFWRFSILFLFPVKFLYFEFKLMDHLRFFIRKTDCTKLLLFELNLHLFFPPKSSGDSNQSMR